MPKFLCAMTGQFPSPPRNRDSTASYSARTGKAEGAASRERAAAGDAEPGARGRRGAGGRRAGRGNAQAPWLAAVLGRPLPPSRSRSWVSAAANLGDLGGGDSSATPRPAPRRSLERGGDGRGRAGAAGAGTLRAHAAAALAVRSAPAPGPTETAAAVRGDRRAACARDAARRICGISWPPRRRRSPARAPGEREGAGGRVEGRGRTRRSAPRLARLRPGAAGPSLPG